MTDRIGNIHMTIQSFGNLVRIISITDHQHLKILCHTHCLKLYSQVIV
ncbi:MAG: hypothetical protein J6W16_04020 [Methanobrevibacter sp.]|nr:hypothetical protein [Methanobrevibacter sp.]